eukprot:m.206522 g.206522  ORF g.206522 m.206522 type:complete len:240 (+) comp25354_c0_seq2:265-984(+)
MMVGRIDVDRRTKHGEYLSKGTNKRWGTSNGDQSHSVRGQPSAAAFKTKKGKACGGRGSWGRLQDEIWSAENMIDEDYYSDEENESGIVMVEKLWDITPDEMRSFCVSELEDYFMSGSTRRILEAIRMVARPGLNAHIVECLITEGIVRDDPERELISSLLAVMVHTLTSYTTPDMEDGIGRVLHRLTELELDRPNVHEVVGKFIARAIVDGIVTTTFEAARSAPHDSNVPVQAVTEAP